MGNVANVARSCASISGYSEGEYNQWMTQGFEYPWNNDHIRSVSY